MILYDMRDDGKDDTCDMKETEAPLNHRFDPHGSHPGGGRIGAPPKPHAAGRRRRGNADRFFHKLLSGTKSCSQKESADSDSDSDSMAMLLYIIYSANGIPYQLRGIPGVNGSIFVSLASVWVIMLR